MTARLEVKQELFILAKKASLGVAPPPKTMQDFMCTFPNNRRYGAHKPPTYTFSDATLFETLYDTRGKKLDLLKYGLFPSFRSYKQHLKTFHNKRLYCTVRECGSTMKSVTHLVQHMILCHPEKMIICLEVPKKPPTSPHDTQVLACCEFPVVKLERKFDLKGTETLKKSLINNISY